MIKYLTILFCSLSIMSCSQNKNTIESIVTNNVNNDLQVLSDNFVNDLIKNDNSKIEILASDELKKIEQNLLEKLKIPINASSKYILNQQLIRNSQIKTPTQFLFKLKNDELLMKFVF